MSTINDVAMQAQVSPATVSRVLSGKGQVRDDTRARVLAAAKELGYSPSRAAQALASGRSSTVGVIAHMASSPSVAERIHGLATRLAPSGNDLTLFDVETPRRQAAVMAELADHERVGVALLISIRPSPEELAAFREAGVPVVAIDVNIPNVDCTYIDDMEGGRMAARNLLANGHRRIAFVGDAEDDGFGFTVSRDRRVAFEDVLASASVQLPSEYLKLGPRGPAYAKQAALELFSLPEPPTAIFAASDVQAGGVLEAARDRGLDIPGDLSVMGFDDIAAARSMGLTTIRQPLEESGAYGAKLALEAIEHQPMGLGIELPLSLVTRRSTGPAPVATR